MLLEAKVDIQDIWIGQIVEAFENISLRDTVALYQPVGRA